MSLQIICSSVAFCSNNSTRTIISGSWTADTVTATTTRTVEVCADRQPGEVPGTAFAGLIFEAPSTGVPTTGNPAEANNCASANTTITRTITIVPPITVQLECEQQGGTFTNNYCIVDYKQSTNLRWLINENVTPSTCTASIDTDWSGAKTPQSYNVSNNPFSLPSLLGKLKFTYQLDCVR